MVVPSKLIQLRMAPVCEQYSQLQGGGAGGSAKAARAVMERIRERAARRTSLYNFNASSFKVDA